MAEKVTKPKAPAKPKKAAATKTSEVSEMPVQASSIAETPSKAKKSSKTDAPVAHSEVAKLAHRYFTERGHKHGHHQDDWFRAEQELNGKAS